MKKGMERAALLLFVASLAFLGSCSRSENPVGNSSRMQSVSMSAVFSKNGAAGLAKAGGLMSTDSLEIDSAIVVFQRIKFESHIDSVSIDSTGDHDSDDDGNDDDVIFRGPFVVHVRDTMVINFANQMLSAGVYDGIKFKIHSIGWGERFEDSDDFNHHPRTINDTTFVGSGIVVWGKVKANGTWREFTYRFGGEVEYKLEGNFVVLTATNVVNVVLRFDIGFWFRDPKTGALLDPTNTLEPNRELINRSIKRSFQTGKCGGDHDRNGWPDDD